ncbi:MAG: helix-turn-helix transcriptional regulator [Chloroflexi bacterium]|nr:helix-turn-helix transcriptional regulator [Chloroflexota bacterium]
MLVIFRDAPMPYPSTGELSTLNTLWLGNVRRSMPIPQLGHLLLAFPMGNSSFSLAGIAVDPSQYLFLSPQADHNPILLTHLNEDESSSILILWLGPMFIKDMASFLGIPPDLDKLLHNLPLLQGDKVTSLVMDMAKAYHRGFVNEILEDICYEIIGEVIQSMRIRQQALQKMAQHKDGTIEDVLPRLLKARQFVESCFSSSLKAREVARTTGISEFHFIRMYKAAFGITLRQHIINLRLDSARHRLETSDESVTEIGLRVGYGSLSSFIHVFSKRFGTSPSTYRHLIKISRI